MRIASLKRKTGETSVEVSLSLDGEGTYSISTGIGFLDHMLALFARHSLIDLEVKAEGDLQVDMHHTVEDVGITVGQALSRALAERRGVRRYGYAYVPMDEALTRVALDLSGRPHLVWNVAFSRSTIGKFDVELLREWFQAFVLNAGITMHVETLQGDNSHHIAESCYKALAHALRQAVELDPRQQSRIPSTKGILQG
ncbi:MAG TPA: imidazoleglycerol-phosphate dehydratase HisB [Aestuariivirgaceae bacterium]|jgi:imidazoleglycerol-phosphate dehydratase|nr:imidazoleglycerol-phosphate dehydratase HisB [Aestuariivirgaceae bacterium]